MTDAASLVELLAERPGDETRMAVHCGDRSVTRAELRASAGRLADALTAAGLAPGQAVTVMLSGGPEVVAALFGVWMAGGVYVPLNPRTGPTEVAHVLEAVPPAAVVTRAEDAGRTGSVPVVLADQALGFRVPSAVDTSAPPLEADVAIITFTSGTTGAPKPVPQRHSGVLAMFEPILGKLLAGRTGSVQERDEPMPNLVPLSLSLWAGLYNVLFAFRVGAAAVVMERFDTGEFARLVARFGIRSTVLPPAAMVMLSDDESLTSLAPLRYVRSITAPLSPLQARRFRDRFGVFVLNGYGQTEFGGEIVGWNAAEAKEFGETHLGAVGRPYDGVGLRILDDDGRDVPVGEEGELWVRTPALEAGTAAGAQLSDRMSPDGWFRSGDIGRLDDEGFLWLSGRVSDMINRGGLKVHPGEIEEVLRLSPAVDDCAVVGAPDDRLGEVPWAFVVPAPGADVDEADLVARCREQLAPYKVPTRFVAVAELPRSEIGKVLRRQLLSGVL